MSSQSNPKEHAAFRWNNRNQILVSRRGMLRRRRSLFLILLLSIAFLGLAGCTAQKSNYVRNEGGQRAIEKEDSVATSAYRTKSKSADRMVSAAPQGRARSESFQKRRSYDHKHIRRPLSARPKVRRGLGTSYGEARYAPVYYSRFQRASHRPVTTFQYNYNNYNGVMAMARRLGRSSCCRAIGVSSAYGVHVQVVDQHRRPLTGLYASGRRILVGRHNQRYMLRIVNRSARRFEIVASVDGLDVIDGRPASVRKRGYLLLPYAVLEIKGFRRSTKYVASFRFNTVRRSYASRIGRGRNIGVIGVALFSEARPAWNPEVQRRLRAKPFHESGYAAPPI